MRLSKNIFWISFAITVVSLIASSILEFQIESNNFTNYINSIIQNILAGTIVLVLTSLVEYHYAKQDSLEELIFELKRINENYLYNLKFWDYRDYPTKEKYITNYKKLYSEDEITFSEEELDKMYNKDFNKYIEKQKEEFNIIIKQYIEISSYDMDMFWIKYRKIGFLLDLGKKRRIYNEIFCYWQDIMKKIQEASFHFTEYLNSEHGNYSVNKEILIKLQEIIFSFEEKNFTDDFTINPKNCDIIAGEMDNIRETKYRLGNKVTKYIIDYTNYLINLTYSKI